MPHLTKVINFIITFFLRLISIKSDLNGFKTKFIYQNSQI
jgi:hypothetical protein